MIPFLTCVNFPLNSARETMAPGFKCNTSTDHTKEPSRNGERYLVLRNENFQMPNVRHQKQRINSLSLKHAPEKRCSKNVIWKGS